MWQESNSMTTDMDYFYGPLALVGPHCFRPPEILLPCILCWSIFLSAYQYSLHYCPGKAMGHTNTLSHLPLPASETAPALTNCIMLPEPPFHASNITSHSIKNHILSHVLGWGWTGWPSSHVDTEFMAYIDKRILQALLPSRRLLEKSFHLKLI